MPSSGRRPGANTTLSIDAPSPPVDAHDDHPSNVSTRKVPEFLTRLPRGQVDLVYADAWPGKFTHLDEALALLRIGGLYVIDDLLPQPNWPEGHASKVDALIADLERRAEFSNVKMSWASGLMILVRTSQT